MNCLVRTGRLMLICNACIVETKLLTISMMRQADRSTFPPTAAFQKGCLERIEWQYVRLPSMETALLSKQPDAASSCVCWLAAVLLFGRRIMRRNVSRRCDS